ncbi:uncharacterized protein [Musca autumnalis]|uniref:uncharacterized protein n=1 Tax=Musca autumnalis TaxID=221902 RepID=UPI003CEC4540
MTEKVSIKTEPFANDFKQEDSTNDTDTVDCSITKLEHFIQMGNDIKEDELDLDKMEEFLPENVDESTIDIIKIEDMDEMNEFLPEDLPNTYSPSSVTCKSDYRMEVITYDEVGLQTHRMSTTTPQISLAKLEIMDVHEDEQDSNGPEVNDNEQGPREALRVANKKVGKYNKSDKTCEDKNATKSVISSSGVAKTPTEHKCELCGKFYGNSNNLLAHIRKKHPTSMVTDYICDICDQTFTTQMGLTKHSFRIHKTAHSTLTRIKHKCELCEKSYTEAKALRTHVRNKHPFSIDTEYVCKICNQRFTTSSGLDRHSYRMHPENQTNTIYKCEMCDNAYTNDKNLRAHIRKKHPSSMDTEYICEICNQRLSTQKGLDLHSYWLHHRANLTQTPANHNCEICGKCYTEDNNLRKHMISKHPSSIETEYICDICNQRFTTQLGLQRHSYRKHPVAKHNCEICGRCYIDNTNLRKHMTSKHPLSIDREYLCEICHKSFTTKIGLGLHCTKAHYIESSVPYAESTATTLQNGRTDYDCTMVE